jgi:signal transduction histidine kinase
VAEGSAPSSHPGGGERIAWILGLAAAYVVTARLGLMMDAVAGFATLVWPPTGIALAVLLRRGRWVWPGVALGAFLVNVWVGAPPAVAAGIAAGNTLEAVAGFMLLRRLGWEGRLEHISEVLRLVFAGAMLSTVASATIGVASLVAGGIVPMSRVPTTGWAWWLGDAMGDIVVAPCLLLWPLSLGGRDAPRRMAEAAGVALAIAAAGAAVFGGRLSAGTYLLFPPLIWAAVRFGPRGAATSVLAVSACAVAGTAAGHGPFVRGELHRGLLELQSFMAVIAVATLVLAATIAERDRARQVAIDALRARDDFVSIAAHELRTPLSTLVLQLGTMRRRLEKGSPAPDAPSPGEQIARAETQADRLAHLVNTLLDVSRIESGQLRVRPEIMDLAELVRDVVDRASEQARRAGCDLHAHTDGAVPGAWDRLRLEQVLTNLLSNAFRHAAGKPVDVTLVAQPDMARIEVRDQGEGVATEQIEALFGRYKRGDGAGERGGLGLGLYISRLVVEAHGGRLKARGEVGVGCTFTMDLPRSPRGGAPG